MSPSALYSRILPFVPGCPEPTVDQAVMDAATEFAERTQLIFTIEAPISLVDGVSTYSVTPVSGISVSLIRHVYCGARELDAVTPSGLQDQLPTWQASSSSEPTKYSCFGEPGTITVYPTPQRVSTEKLRIVASWEPTFGATQIPDELVTGYARDIVEGAKARLMMIPERKWTNLQLAGIAEGKFEAAVAEGKIKAIHAKAAGSLHVRPRKFGWN